MDNYVEPISETVAPRQGVYQVLTDYRVLLVIIFLAALALRLAYLQELRDTPFFSGLVADEVSYDRWAQEIASGKLLGHQIYYQEPAYPYFLALIYSLFGRNFGLVFCLQALLSSTAVFFIFGIGNRCFHDRRVGLLAALFWSGYKVEFFFIGQILKASLGVFLLTAALWIILVAKENKRPGWTAAAGFFWGLLLLIGGNFYFAMPLVLGWLMVELKELPRKRFWALTGAWLCGFALAPGLCSVRNWKVSGQMVVTTAQGGTNFYLANFKDNFWGTSVNPPFSSRIPGQEFSDFRAEAERREGRPFTDAEVSDYWFKQTWKEMSEDPGLAALRLLRKTLILVNRHELTPNLNFSFFQTHYSRLLKLPLPAFWLAGPLGLAGLALAWRRREGRLLALFIGGYSFSLLVFYSYGRFRHPLIPALLVFAAYFTVACPRAARRGEYRQLLFSLGLAAALEVIAFPQWRPAADEYTYNKICFLHYNKGEFQEAIEACQRALEINPSLEWARVHLALSLEQRLRFDEAAAVYREAIRLDPNKPSLHYLLAHALEMKGDVAGAAAEYNRAAQLERDSKARPDHQAPEVPPL